MPDIKLGLTGYEVTLPPVNWMSPGELELPVGLNKNLDRATMLDGSVRYNVREKHQRTFRLEWAMLTQAQLDEIRALVELNEPLRLSTNRPDADWVTVVVSRFEFASLESTHATGTSYYRVSLSLEEIN